MADFLHLPPVTAKLMFSQFSAKDSMKHLLGLQLWQLFWCVELTEIVRQNDKLFINCFNKIRVGNTDDDVEKLLKARFIYESYEDYSKDALNIYVEKESTMKKNGAVLNDLLGELYTIEANDKISSR